MKEKKLIIGLLIVVSIITGCAVKKEQKDDKFEDAEKVVSSQQINIHFAYKDKELKDKSSFTFEIDEIPEDTSKYGIYRISHPILVVDGKLGLCIKVDGNKWSISSLYTEGAKKEFAVREDTPEPYYGLYSNASWKLEPLLDNYQIWLDDYTINDVNKDTSNIPSIDLFRLVDQTTGTEFLYSLKLIYDDDTL